MRKTRYRIETSREINRKQVNRRRIIYGYSEEAAEEEFRDMWEKDSTIQEGAVIRVRDNKVIAERSATANSPQRLYVERHCGVRLHQTPHIFLAKI